MDVDLVSSAPILRSAATASPPALPDAGFAASLSARASEGASTVDQAEQLIGTRIRAPEGGCGCDAFVNLVAPTPAGRPSPASDVPQLPTLAAVSGQGFAPGQVLTFTDPDRSETSDDATSELRNHLHRAILRNATEMITANRSGVVEVLTVPWSQVRRP